MAGIPTNPQGTPGGTNPKRPMSPQGQPLQPGQPCPAGGQQAGRPVAAGQRPIPAAGQPMRPVPVGNRPVPARDKKPGDIDDEKDKAKESESEEGEILEEVAKKAPPWLISTVLHTVVVIILGVWVTVSHVRHESNNNIAAEVMTPEERYAEELGDQLQDENILVAPEHFDKDATENIIVPQDLPPVDDPLAAPPQLSEMDLAELPSGAGTTSFSDIKAPMVGYALSGRQAGSKKNQLLGKYGGTKLTQDAVVSGLQWLAKQQKADGSWSLTGPFKDGGSEENIPAATAMALLAFQGDGHTHLQNAKNAKHNFKDNVAKGWKFLLKLQEKDGNFVTKGPSHQRLYAQAQCTIALCELYGMTKDSSYRQPAERAIKYALAAQDKKLGGWRYIPGEDSDTSVTGWYVMALQNAKMAKLEVPQAALDNISRFLDSVQTNDGKSYTYTQGTFSTMAVTAEGLLCREYLGWKQNDPRLIEGVTALNRNPVDYNSGERDIYYWYYATQACHHMEGRIWDDWNSIMRQEVPSHQVKKGPEAGSWDPDGDKWGSYGGRLYVSCLSMYMLEVYYRHLPIYSGYKFGDK